MTGDAQRSSGQARGLNGRLLGPVDSNPYNSSVAPAFHFEDGSRPQTDVRATQPTPDWNQQAITGQKLLDDLATTNQEAMRKNAKSATTVAADIPSFGSSPAPINETYTSTAALFGSGKPARIISEPTKRTETLPAANSKGDIQHIGSQEISQIATATAVYSQWIHPLIQRALIPQQMQANAKEAEGLLPPSEKLFQAPRRLFLENFSRSYRAQLELAKSPSLGEVVNDQFFKLQSNASKRYEALNISKDELNALKLKAATRGGESLVDVQQAREVVQIHAELEKQRIPLVVARAKELSRLESLRTIEPCLLEPHNYDWETITNSMRKDGGFAEHEVSPIVEAAAKNSLIPFENKMLPAKEVDAIARSIESKKGFVEATFSLAGKIAGPALIVGAEAFGQGKLASTLADNNHNELAKICEPSVVGSLAKSSALLIPSLRSKGIGFAGAQLYEAESNMNRFERAGTTAVGFLPAMALKFAGKSKLATTFALANLGVGLAAELTSDLFKNDDSSFAENSRAIKLIQSRPDDCSQGFLETVVQALKSVGKTNQYLLAQDHDAISQDLRVSAQDSVDESRAKYKHQLIVAQADGETILANGLSKNESLRLQNLTAQIEDQPFHKENWRLAPNERIDIGGQGSRALIGAVGSANLLEYALARKSKLDSNRNTADDIVQVEKQKQKIKDELTEIFSTAHPQQIENALKKSQWWFGDSINDFNLVELWSAASVVPGHPDKSEYDHVAVAIGTRADFCAQSLPAMQTKLLHEQELLKSAQQSPENTENAATRQKLVQARQDALELSIAYTAKLYRDKALMRLGQVQGDINLAHAGQVVTPTAPAYKLIDAANALSNAARYAPNNPDLIELEQIAGSMNSSVKALQPRNF